LIIAFVVRLVGALTVGAVAALIGSRFYQPPEEPPAYPGYPGWMDQGSPPPPPPGYGFAPPTGES
jgi:hypothetical protein